MTLFDLANLPMGLGLWGVLALPLILVLLPHSRLAWLKAKWLSGLGVLLALGLWLAALQAPVSSGVLRAGFVQASLLLLVSALGWLIYRYSASNFQGDADGRRFLRYLACTLLAVKTLLLADQLLVFWAAWVAVSISLHQLLVFYPERPRARLAAHKKFLLARGAEGLLALAIGLLYSQTGSWSLAANLDQLTAAATGWAVQLAAVCLAAVALIKCAQLPLHGWLIQVVEAPTPVSALLHAGIINLGGVLLLLFAPLLSQVAAAQWLLLLVAAPSAVLAALIMSTRISVKVRLAWSTCAQMGLMLVECALGLYELALLHLIAHSCYKAHAFLAAGSAVQEQVRQQLSGAAGGGRLPLLRHWLAGAALVVPWVVTAAVVLKPVDASQPWAPWLLLSLAFISWAAQLLALPVAGAGELSGRLLRIVAGVAGLLATYSLLKTALAQSLDLTPAGYNRAADLWVCSWLLILAAASYALQRWPLQPQLRRLWIALHGGLYLDEWMSRLTLRWWPLPLTASPTHPVLRAAKVKS